MSMTPGRGVADPGDDLIHLVARQLAAFAGLCALRHLDLQFARVHEVVARDAEAARGHLFDRALFRIAVGKRNVALLILAAFAGVRCRAETVHGDRHGLVRLLADGAEGHRRGRRTA